MNQIERQMRRQRPKNRIWHNVVRSWIILGTVTFLVGTAAGVALSGQTQATEAPVVVAQNNFQNPEFVVMRTVPLSVELQKHVFNVSREYGLDWSLVMAVIQQESRYDVYAQSAGGDFGLMQINEINHPELSIRLGIHDFLDPKENVRAGCYMLRDLFEKYGDAHKVLMAYHMGESGAAACWEQGITESQYSRSVLRIQEELLALQQRREPV